jgi:hypothetical protein
MLSLMFPHLQFRINIKVSVDALKTPYKAIPSPLRMQHGPTPGQVSPSASLGTPSPGASQAQLVDSRKSSGQRDAQVLPAATSTKRGVRFAEDDKDDQIPLGYVLRMKKRREEKVKFLQEEKERRAFEEERLKVERERRKHEAERREWEKEKKAWEREKRAMEEERRQKLYAEEVAAARRRRESQRGGTLGTSTSSSSLSGELDPQRTRHSKKYSRPTYDSSRSRTSSDLAIQYSGSEPPSPNTEWSPSRAPSNSGSSHLRSRNNSRPPSIHSNFSTEDVEAGGEGRGKRSSIGSVSSSRRKPDRASSWSSGHVPPVPMVPTMPMFPVDTLLLPPAPPFMMQQYSRRSSQSPTTPSSGTLSGNRSSSQVNLVQHSSQRRPVSSSSSPGRQESQFSAPTSPREHQRRSSGDGGSPPSATSQSRGSTSQRAATRSHGRPPLPSPYLQLPANPTHSSSSVTGRPPVIRQQTIS